MVERIREGYSNVWRSNGQIVDTGTRKRGKIDSCNGKLFSTVIIDS